MLVDRDGRGGPRLDDRDPLVTRAVLRELYGPGVLAVVVNWAGALVPGDGAGRGAVGAPAAKGPRGELERSGLPSLAITSHIVLPITCMSEKYSDLAV